jgi:D-amino-acid oxidase
LARLARDVPEAGIHFQGSHPRCSPKYNTVLAETTLDYLLYSRSKDSETGQSPKEHMSRSPWFKDVVPNFRVLSKHELPLGMQFGTAFTSVCINTAIYLPYLVGQCLKNGVVIRREVLTHISEAASLHHSGMKVDVVVNCTGLLASKLGGVMDQDLVPARGQIVVVRNTPGVMITTSSTDDGEDELCYIMERAAGGGTILGGTYQKGNWDSQPDPNQALRIMTRAVEICPALTGGKGIEALSIIRHGVGLRPLRLSGVRIEKEKIGATWIVHNYGHGGWGYQGSYGCTERAIELVEEVLTPKSKL